METQIHLVSNSNFLDSIYELNLRAYIGVEPVVHSKKEAFQAESKRNILSKRIFLIPENRVHDLFDEIKLLQKNDKNELYVIGDPKKDGIEFDHVLKNRFDLRELVRSMARALEITAKDMVKKEVPTFYPIRKAIFKFLTKAPEKIFFDDDKSYECLFEKGEEITSKLDDIEDDYLYVNAADRLSFINRSSILIIDELRDEELTAAEKIELSVQGIQFVANEIYDSEKVSEEVAHISGLCVKTFNDVSNGVPKAKNLIALLLENQDGYVYGHSIFSTYIAKEIISQMPWGSKEQKEKVGFVLFFHDLYLVPIYGKYEGAIDEEALLFRDDISDEDKEIIFDHASLIANMIKTYPHAPMGADSLVAQHHGSPNGKGFPGVFGDDISPLAKVIVISEEITKHVFESLHGEDKKVAFDKKIIKKKLLNKFQRLTYKKIIEAFDQVEL